MLTRADFVALDGPFTKKKKNHFIAFLFQVPLRLSHSSVQKFQSHPSADVSMPHIFREGRDKQCKQWDSQYLRVNLYQSNVFISN